MSKIIKRYVVTSSIVHPILEHLHGQLRLWQFSMNLRAVSSFWNVHCLQRKLLVWKGRIFQNTTVITICSWWKASSLMGGYPAWFLWGAHPLPVPVSNRKSLKQRREEHWLPGNCNAKWRNGRRELCYKQASLSDLSCNDLQSQHRIESFIYRCCWGRLQGSLAGFFWWRSYASWGELGMKEAKKLSLRDVKDKDNVILNIYFASINWVSRLAVPSKVLARIRAVIFPKYLCLFEHLLIDFSCADGNLGRKVASPLPDLPFCLKLACCQVPTTFFTNPAFSLGFSWPVVKATLSPVKEHGYTTYLIA